MSCNGIATYDFSLYKGDDKTKTFRYLADGSPVNLTDYVIQFECTVSSLDQDAVIADPASGEYSFTFSKALTEVVTENRVKYEVVFYPTGLGGEKITKYRGSINFQDEVV